jgi:hypothetical protein
MTFIVRVTRDASGRLSGFVERVKTHEKEPFAGAEALGRIIDRFARDAEHEENEAKGGPIR